jgi:hypothetical protein
VRVFVLSVGFVELFDSPQVSSGEAADARKLGAQIFGEILNYGTPPGLTLLPLVDEPSDVPVKRQQLQINRA